MQPQLTNATPLSVRRSLLSVLLLGLLSVCLLFSLSPSFHKLLHPDAGESTHECAITLLHQQQVLPAQPVFLPANHLVLCRVLAPQREVLIPASPTLQRACGLDPPRPSISHV